MQEIEIKEQLQKKEYKNANIFDYDFVDQKEEFFTGQIFNKELFDDLQIKFEKLQLKEEEQLVDPILIKDNTFDILGTIQSSRFFTQKNQSEDDIVFIQIVDQKNTSMITLCIEKKSLTDKQKYECFQEYCKILKQNTLINFKCVLGANKFKQACLYGLDFKIIKVQPQFNVAFNFLCLNFHNLINTEDSATALQITTDELTYIFEIGQEQFQDKKLKEGNKQENLLKKKLVEITRQLLKIPINRVRMRPPVFPLKLYEQLEKYEKNININKYTCEYINFDKNEENNNQDQFQFCINIPDITDTQRMNYIKNKKEPQVKWFCEYLQKHFIKNKSQYNIIDIGGGRGDLSITIAQNFPHCNLTVVDINKESLQVGEQLGQKLGLKNIKFVHSSIETLQTNQSYDLIIGLHTCGGLTEAILNYCSSIQSDILICTCCFSSQGQLVPENYKKLQKKWYTGEEEGKKMLCRYSESHKGYEIAEKCMKIVNSIRLNCFYQQIQDLNQEISENQKNIKYELKMVRFPVQYSLKNILLHGKKI